MASDPIKTFYLKGWGDTKNPSTMRKTLPLLLRKIPQNFKLAYINGWFDAHMNRACRYD